MPAARLDATLRALVDGGVELVLIGSLLCVTLPKLIELERAAGRPRDLDALAELEVLLARRNTPAP